MSENAPSGLASPTSSFERRRGQEALGRGGQRWHLNAAKLGRAENIFQKFNVHDRTAAMAEALRRGIIHINQVSRTPGRSA